MARSGHSTEERSGTSLAVVRGDDMAELYRYAAFISYSSHDAKFAKRLHRALETYTIPKSLGEFDIINGGKKNRIYPVFRDREELAAGHLGDVIEANLRASSALIVVCSMNAAASPWVQKEIEYFASLGRADRIFAIVTDDAPLLDQHGADATPLCFPPAFRGDTLAGDKLEPLAADARKVKDGFRNAWLKLIAGLVGRSPGQIVDRDNARRRRFGAIAAAAAVVAVTIAATSAYYVSRAITVRSAAAAQASQRAAQSRAREDLNSIRTLFAAGREREALALLFSFDASQLDPTTRGAIDRVRQSWSGQLALPPALLTDIGAAVLEGDETIMHANQGLVRLPGAVATMALPNSRYLLVANAEDFYRRPAVLDARTDEPPPEMELRAASATFTHGLLMGTVLFSSLPTAASSQASSQLFYPNGQSSAALPSDLDFADQQCRVGIYALSNSQNRLDLGAQHQALTAFANPANGVDGTVSADPNTASSDDPVRTRYTIQVNDQVSITFVSLDGQPLPEEKFPHQTPSASQLAGLRHLASTAQLIYYCTIHDWSEPVPLTPPFVRPAPLHWDPHYTAQQHFIAAFAPTPHGLAQNAPIPPNVFYAGPAGTSGERVAIGVENDVVTSCIIAAGGRCTARQLHVAKVLPHVGLLFVQADHGYSFVDMRDLRAATGITLPASLMDSFNASSRIDDADQSLFVLSYEADGTGDIRRAAYSPVTHSIAWIHGTHHPPTGERISALKAISDNEILLFGTSFIRMNLQTGMLYWTYGQSLWPETDESGDGAEGTTIAAVSPDHTLVGIYFYEGESLTLLDLQVGLPLGRPHEGIDLQSNVYDGGVRAVELYLGSGDTLEIGNDSSATLYTRTGTERLVPTRVSSAHLTRAEFDCAAGARREGDRLVLVDISNPNDRRACGLEQFLSTLHAARRINLNLRSR